jgi:hypothetical protein
MCLEQRDRATEHAVLLGMGQSLHLVTKTEKIDTHK